MSKYVDMMDEMADLIRAAVAGSDVAVQVEPRMNLNPTPPSVDIFPGDPFVTQETAGFGEEDDPVFTVRVRVGTADSVAGQDLLLALMDPEDDLSVAAALNTDRTLNGLATDIYVQGQAGWAVFGDSGDAGALLGYQWRVLVLNAAS